MALTAELLGIKVSEIDGLYILCLDPRIGNCLASRLINHVPQAPIGIPAHLCLAYSGD
jgi:hypothetical protein